MRILFSAVPIPGHTLPLLPMAAAARDAGHEAAVLSSAELEGMLKPFDVLVAGPPFGEQVAETVRRVGKRWIGPGPDAAECFAGTRVDMTFDEALERAREFRPELVVCDLLDYVGPTVAAALGVPWAVHGISGGLPPVFTDALAERWSAQLAARRLRATDRLAYVDPYPDVLRGADPAAADRVPVRPEAYDRDDAAYDRPHFADPSRPRVLMTLGTSVSEEAVADSGTFAGQMVESLVEAGFDVLITDDPPAGGAGALPAHARHIGFVPLARVLDDVELVVCAGGTGTVLAALAAGLPLVIRPFLADQPLNAQRVARVGVAAVITEAAETGPAARTLLADPAVPGIAAHARAELAALPGPGDGLRELLARLPAAG